jgi:hypothetical protein
MTVPRLNPLVAVTYKSAMDDPSRIAGNLAACILCRSDSVNGLWRVELRSRKQDWYPPGDPVGE